MSWVTIIWSMIASACFTLAAIYFVAWYKNRAAWATLLFSVTAVSTTGFAFCELWMMRAQTPADLNAALRWAQVPLFFWLVSIVWFVWNYLGAGRLWLAWIITGMRASYLLLTFLGEQNINISEIGALRHIQFLGESVTVLGGVPNPVMLFGQFCVLLILAFVADAGVTAWRRGDRRKALMVGGSIEFYLLTALGSSSLVLWANIQVPIVFSWLYLGLVAAMGYELSRDLLRASQLVNELQASEARSQAILRAMPDLTFLQTTDGVYLDYHTPDPDLLLLPPDQFLGRNMREVLPPALLDRIEPAFARATEESGPVVVEYDMDLRDGNRWFEARLVRNSHDQILTLVRDVTEHKRAEAALRESAQRYTLATTAGAVGVWDRNLETSDLYVDATIKAILGFEDAEIPNRVEEWKTRVHPEDAEAMTQEQASIPADTEVRETEHRMTHKDGSFRWFLSHASVMRRADGSPYRMVGTSVDITERKRSADQFRLALEASTTGMLMVDCSGMIALVNAHVETLFGYRREELINKPVHMLIPERRHAVRPEDQSGFRWDGGAFPIRGSREISGVRKDGTEIPVEIGFSPLHTPEGEFVLCSIADITERKHAEREREDLTRHLRDLAGRLIAAQEVERARIARDLHDDVSQQLAALSIGLSGLKRRAAAVPNDPDLHEDVSSLQQRTSMLADSVRGISHDLHPDVIRHVGLAVSLSGYCKGLSVSQALPVTCSAEGDFESIDQEAALCLYRIAQEALQNVVKHAHARKVEVRLLRTGESAELTIADDGIGFDIQMRRSGPGLGLVSITERARLSGGTVSIVTVLNKGTQVRVQVPINVRTTTAGNQPGRFAASV